jgi:hypothetical protein
VRPLLERYAAQEIDLERVHGWIAHAAHGDIWGLRRKLLGKVVVRPAPGAKHLRDT